MKMLAKSVVVGLAYAILVGLLVSALPTYLDWRRNPGGVFQGSSGTNWDVVFETLFSWFWPTVLVAAPIAIVIHAWRAQRSSTDAT